MEKHNLNNSSISFEQDKYIHFEEASHTYTVDNIGTMRPGSSIISKFFTPFDARYWSLKKCFGDEIEAEKLREEWEYKGAIASQSGTHLHKQIENYLNGENQIDLNCTTKYDGKYIHVKKDINISKEWSYFKTFDKDVTYTPFRTEWCVYDISTHMAGTIDLLCSCADGSYEIFDWKRSNRINPQETNSWSYGINGLEHLTDTAYSHYCLQQNLYRYMLEKNYGLKITNMRLVVLHPDNPSYRLIRIPRMEKEVNIIIDKIS